MTQQRRKQDDNYFRLIIVNLMEDSPLGYRAAQTALVQRDLETPPMNETAGLSTRSALLSGIVFGAAWYVGAQTILDTAAPSLASVPVWGGLFFAAGIPAFLMRYVPSGRDRFAAFDLPDDEVWVIQRTSGRVMF